MKKQILGFFIGITVATGFAFTSNEYSAGPSTAEAGKVEGLYVFTDCKPVLAYDSLGLVDPGFITGTQYENIRNSIIKRVIKKHPEAEGVIFLL